MLNAVVLNVVAPFRVENSIRENDIRTKVLGPFFVVVPKIWVTKTLVQ
jgi:hypothetical protein